MDERKKQITNQDKARRDSVSSFSRQIKAFLDRELRRLIADVEGREVKAIDAARILGGIRSKLVEAGLGNILAEIEELYGKELLRLEESLARYGKGVTIFTSADVTVVQTLATFDIEQFANQIDVTVDEFRSVVMRQVLSGQPVDGAEIISKLSDRAESYGETNLNTALSGMYRSFTVSKSQELGLELYLYVGPDDDITRPFCEARVGKVYTLDEIKDWDNEQGLDPLIYCGGYNCRHQLSPISLEDAVNQYGYKSN